MPKAIKQLFIVGAVLAIAMVFVIQFRPGTDVKVTAGPSCAVENGGTCIVSQADFVAAYRIAAPPSLDNDEIENQLRVLVIEGLIQRWLLSQDAERLEIGISDDDITRHLGKGLARVSLPVDQENYAAFIGLVLPPDGPARRMNVEDPKTGKFEYERYKRWVAQVSSKTLKDFREFAHQEAIAARMRALIRARVRVSEAEAFADFAHRNAKIVVDYVKLERGWYDKYVIDRSDETVDTWAAVHQEEVDGAFDSRKETFLPGCRRARQILIRVDESAGDKDAARSQARGKLEAAIKRINKGAKFAEVARELSEDQSSRDQGGDLGCFAAGKLAKPNTTKAIDDAAHALDKGKLSEIIETGLGLHVVRLDAVLAGKDAEKLGRREAARDLYLRMEAERLTAEAGKQILAAVAAGKSLEQALAAHLDAVLPATAKEAFARGRASAAGAEDEGKKGAEDEGKKNGDEGGDAGDHPADAWTDPARPRVETSDAFTAAGPPFGGVQDPTEATRLLFKIDQPGAVPGDIIKLYDGYAVAQLKEKQPVKKEDWDSQRRGHMARMLADRQRDALVAYVHLLREQFAKSLTYKIKVKKEVRKKGSEGDG